MKKSITLIVLSLCISAPSFAAEHIASHSAKVAGKETYKPAKEAGKAGKAVAKFLF